MNQEISTLLKPGAEKGLNARVAANAKLAAHLFTQDEKAEAVTAMLYKDQIEDVLKSGTFQVFDTEELKGAIRVKFQETNSRDEKPLLRGFDLDIPVSALPFRSEGTTAKNLLKNIICKEVFYIEEDSGSWILYGDDDETILEIELVQITQTESNTHHFEAPLHRRAQNQITLQKAG